MSLRTSRQRIQHLLRRAGFGYRADELNEYVALGLEGTIDRLLAPLQVADDALDAELEPLLAPFAGDPKDMDVERAQRQALFEVWYRRMAGTNRPVLERMTYFWHDHFATAISKVGRPGFMQRQNDTLRAGALGMFPDLLLSVARDPAMLVYLDNRSNAKGAPNENFARELFELHTLGEGNGYTEQDIKEAARALTGWRLTEDGNGAVLRPNMFDAGRKTILGRSGNFNDQGLISLVATHPNTAAHIADKLVRFFVHPDGSPALTARAADRFAATGGNITEVLRVIFTSDEMYSDAAYRSIVKSPTEVVVGMRRALEMPVDGQVEAQISNRMGQRLFDPPNPAGWTGGAEWINGTTVLTRANFATETTSMRGRGADIPALLRRYGATASADAVVDWLLDLLVGGDVDADTRSVLVEHVGGASHFNFEQAAKDGRLHGVAYLILAMPLYQVA